MLVVDSSILVSAFLPDETGPDLEALFEEFDEVLAPTLLWVELRNILLVAERRGRLTEAMGDTILDAIGNLGIVTDQMPPGTRVTRLVRRHGLSAYDALYLELAVRHGATLAIFDLALERAARAEGVAVASWDRGWETSPRQRLTPAFYGESVDGTGE